MMLWHWFKLKIKKLVIFSFLIVSLAPPITGEPVNEIEIRFIKAGLSETQSTNRKLLADTMQQAGFLPLSYEWWHFNGLSKSATRKKYPIIE